MTPRRAIFLTARREIRERLRSRAFMLGIAAQVVLVLVVVVVAALTSGGTDKFELAAIDREGAAIADAAKAQEDAFDVELTVTTADTIADARARIADGDLDAAVSGTELLTGTNPDQTLVALLQTAHREVAGARALREAGVDESRAGAILNPPPLRVGEIDDGSSGQGLAFVGSLYLYIALLILGLTIATGVTEEKSTRVVEVILAAIRPVHLLAGKILGIGLVGLASVLLVTVVGLGSALAISSIELPDSTADVAVLVVVYFILGYLLYACAYSVAGVIVSAVGGRPELVGAAQPHPDRRLFRRDLRPGRLDGCGRPQPVPADRADDRPRASRPGRPAGLGARRVAGPDGDRGRGPALARGADLRSRRAEHGRAA